MNNIDNIKYLMQYGFPNIVSSYEDMLSCISTIISSNCNPNVVPQDIVANIYECYDIVDCKPQDLKQIQKLLPTTKFAVSQNVKNRQQTFSIDYSDISTQIFNDVKSKLGLHTMAFEHKEDYALSNHNHDKLYSKIEYTQILPPGEDISTLGVMHIQKDEEDGGKVLSDMYITCPKLEAEFVDVEEIAIGTLKFVGIDYINQRYPNDKLVQYNKNWNVDINADDFDGWVFPNGTQFDCGEKDFRKACRIYSRSKSEDATTFVVPNLTAFIKPNPGKIEDAPMGFHTARYLTGKHSHNLNTDLKAEIKYNNIIVSFPMANGKSSTGDLVAFLWSYDGIKCSEQYDGTTVFNMKNYKSDIKLQTSREQKTANPFEPQHYNMPVMIYIGVKNYDVQTFIM